MTASGASSAARGRPAPRLPRNQPFAIAGHLVAPGTRRNLELPVASLPTDTSLSMSLAVLNGLRPGPVLWLSAVVHGDELNGIEIIRQVLRGRSRQQRDDRSG